MSFKKIIESIVDTPRSVRIKFHAQYSRGIVGSDNKNVSGKYFSADRKIRLANPINKRNKNLLSVTIAIIFIITFPVHFLFQKSPLHFFKNVFEVLFLRQTWVGYASSSNKLPAIKKGILTSSGSPASLNTLPLHNLQIADEWYALDYTVWTDIRLIIKGYKFLSE